MLYIERAVSAIWGVVAVVATYLLTRQVLSKDAALLAAGFLPLLPPFLFIATSFSNDMALVGLVAVAIWQMVRWMKSGISKAGASILGLTMALAILSRLMAAALIAVLVVAAVWDFVKHRRVWESLTRCSLALGVVVTATGGTEWPFR